MNYAQIKNGIVENIIVLEDDSLIQTFSDGFDSFVVVDGMDPMPQIGWGYDGTNFVPAIAPALNTQISSADFGLKLMGEFTKYNLARGLTSTQRLAIAQALAPYAVMVQSGDLSGFVDVVGNIPVDGVLITQPIIDYFVSAISSYINGTPQPSPGGLAGPTGSTGGTKMSKKKKGK